jgi:hypothetical protein
MEVRIGIVGSAGTGKSAFGRGLAAELGVPFLEAKQITLDILRRDGYDYAAGVQVERFLSQGTRQDEILKRTIENENANTTYVTDRTVVDLAAYAVAELHDKDPVQVSKMFKTCEQQAKTYTHLFLCPWGTQPLANNKVRTLNPWYQFVVHSLDIAIMQLWELPYTVMEMEDVQGRVEVVRGLFTD